MRKPPEFEASLEEIKHQAVKAIARKMKKAELSQTELATSVGLPQPRISELLNGKTQRFGIDGINRVLAYFNLSIRVYYNLAPLKEQAKEASSA